MAYLNKNVDATLVSVRLTDKGRELLAKGLKEDNVFDIVKFSFGDSEVNYNTEDANIEVSSIMEPVADETDLVNKIYATGTAPSGTSNVNISTTSVDMSQNQTGINVSVYTNWPPVEGVYQEDYEWKNLGPLNDWDFKLVTSTDNKVGTLTTYNVVGTTTIRVKGLTTGKYKTFTLTIS